MHSECAGEEERREKGETPQLPKKSNERFSSSFGRLQQILKIPETKDSNTKRFFLINRNVHVHYLLIRKYMI